MEIGVWMQGAMLLGSRADDANRQVFRMEIEK
jgi:hypothetical protein